MLGKSLEQLEEVLKFKESRLKEAREALGTVKSSMVTISGLDTQIASISDKLACLYADREYALDDRDTARKVAEKLLKG